MSVKAVVGDFYHMFQLSRLLFNLAQTENRSVGQRFSNFEAKHELKVTENHKIEQTFAARNRAAAAIEFL